jgi:hypothetical protein
MNSTFKHDSHPDAESLNAFAEQALPESEHSQVLAHLAACSRCRQVVFLAHQAASEFEMQEAVAARPELDRAAAYGFAAAMAPAPMAAAEVASGRSTEKGKRWWSGGWRLAWAPAAALAAIIGLVVFVHERGARLDSESGSESRLVVPQSPTQTQPKPAEPQSADKEAMQKVQPAASPSAKVPKENAVTASAMAPVEAFSAQPAPQAQAAATPGAMAMSSAAAVATPRPELAVGANSFNDASVGAASATLHGAAGQVQASRSVSANAMAPQSTLSSAAMGSFISGQQISEPRTTARAIRKAEASLLPSGLRAVSSVTAQHRTLAIDSSGMMFLSEDSGDHWERVARQWSGRATVVRIQGRMDIGAATTAEANAAVLKDDLSSNPGDVTASPAVFEVVNDSDQVWISIDGKTWKAK